MLYIYNDQIATPHKISINAHEAGLPQRSTKDICLAFAGITYLRSMDGDILPGHPITCPMSGPFVRSPDARIPPDTEPSRCHVNTKGASPLLRPLARTGNSMQPTIPVPADESSVKAGRHSQSLPALKSIVRSCPAGADAHTPLTSGL